MDNEIRTRLNLIHGQLTESLGQIKVDTGYDPRNGYHIRLVTENTVPKMDIRIRQDSGLKSGHMVKWDYLSDPNDPTSVVMRESVFPELPRHIIEVHRKGQFDHEHLNSVQQVDFDTTEESQDKTITIKGDSWTILNENKRPLFSGTGGMDGANTFLKETKI